MPGFLPRQSMFAQQPGGMLAQQDDGGMLGRLQDWWQHSTAFKPMYDAAVSAAMLPGDVLSGAQPTMAFNPQTGEVGADPQLMDRAMNVASNLTLGGAATAPLREAGVGIFGGRLARTADHAALKKAEYLAANGAGRDQILHETGWFKGPDDKWRFEIDDSASRIGDKALSDLTQMGSHGATARTAAGILHHKKLYDAYPSARNMDVDARYNSDLASPSGSYEDHVPGSRSPQINMSLNALAGDKGPRSILLHEMQHHIQDVEGFAAGGSPASMHEVTAAGIAGRAKFVKSMIDGERAALQDPKTSAAAKEFAKKQIVKYEAELATLQAAQPRSAMEGYQALAGETEARNVQQRRSMTANERRRTPPWTTQDIPNEMQFVRMRPSSGSSSR